MFERLSVLDTIAKAMRNANMPDVYEQQANAAADAHRRAQLQNQYYAPDMESQLNLRKAHANLYNKQISQTNDPMHKLSTYPELFKAQALYRNYADKYGEGHPISQEAKKNYEIMQNTAQNMGDWKGEMAKTASYRFLPTPTKLLLDAGQSNAGNYPSAARAPSGKRIDPKQQMVPFPGSSEDSSLAPRVNTNNASTLSDAVSNNQGAFSPVNRDRPVASSPPGFSIAPKAIAPTLSQMQQQEGADLGQQSYKPTMDSQDMAGLLTSAAIKNAAPIQTINRVNSGNSALITLDNMLKDADALGHYTGIKGRAKLVKDEIAAGSGDPTPEYIAYNRYMSHAGLLNKQLRNFYGDSVQLEAAKKIEKMTDPSKWNVDPKTLKETIGAFNKTFRQEHRNLQKSIFEPMKAYKASQEEDQERAGNQPSPKNTLSDAIRRQGAGPISGQNDNVVTLRGKQYVLNNGKWSEL